MPRSKKNLQIPKKKTPPAPSNQTRNISTKSTIFDSFKSGLGFGAGMEAVKTVSDTLSNNTVRYQPTPTERCMYERKRLFSCLDENFDDLNQCVEYMRIFKNCYDNGL